MFEEMMQYFRSHGCEKLKSHRDIYWLFPCYGFSSIVMTRYKERKAKYRSSYYRNIDITRNVPLQYEGFGGGGSRTLQPSAMDTGVWNTKYGYLKQYLRNKWTNREGWKKNEEPNISTCAITRNIRASVFLLQQEKEVISSKSNTLSLVSKSVPVTLGY
jgi:hypothetical protein